MPKPMTTDAFDGLYPRDFENADLLAACEAALAYLVASVPPVVAGESRERCALGALRLRLESAIAKSRSES